MTSFNLVEPHTLAEAAGLLTAEGARPIAGGTAIMLMLKAGVFRPATLVSLRKIEPRYSRIALAADGALHIGAMASLRQIELSSDVAGAAPVVTSAMARLANVRVRNAATIGGALAHADPHLDLPPVLIALGARVAIAGPGGERALAVEDLFRGYLETALDPGELIAEVVVPGPGRAPRSLSEAHHPLRRRLAGARHCPVRRLRKRPHFEHPRRNWRGDRYAPPIAGRRSGSGRQGAGRSNDCRSRRCRGGCGGGAFRRPRLGGL